MDGIHDLGGMQGFGAVPRDESSWHDAWERRVFGLTLGVSRIGNIDDFRHAIERLDPRLYLTAGYFGRWLAATETRCVERGLLTSDEVDERAPVATAVRPTAVANVSPPAPPAWGTQRRDVDRGRRFRIGDDVVAADIHPDGHTRLPRYVRGHRGRVRLAHPAFVLPDSNAHGRGEDPQYVYGVEFSARELWGAGDHVVTVDIFEPHLRHA